MLTRQTPHGPCAAAWVPSASLKMEEKKEKGKKRKKQKKKCLLYPKMKYVEFEKQFTSSMIGQSTAS